ncbi:MAG: thioredoxin [Sphingobacteriales bacterium]|nr:MAG: thioredoxin [Sphingobacteriales bacterium]
MRKLLTLVAMTISMNVMAQSDFDILKDAENGAVVYKGEFTVDDLHKEASFSWMDNGINSYKPNEKDVEFLKTHLPAYKMIVALGTWCEDSQNLVPKLYKTLNESGYPISQITMIGVDRAKTAKHNEHEHYNIKFVPTIILLKDGKEIGRIVETVQKSIETDLVTLIEKTK